MIEAVRTEQAGRRLERTIYTITNAGRQELASLQDKVLHDITLPPDPFDVALWFSGSPPTPSLAAAIDRRSQSLQELRDRLAEERIRLTEGGYLPTVCQLLFRHGELRIEAELRWHAELEERLFRAPTPPAP